jgi:putative PIN family toxin of toxin-antitoxin system
VKVVVDTNVIVSALFTPAGTCGQVLDVLVEGVAQPCIDSRITGEYEEALLDPLATFKREHVNTVLEMFRAGAEPVAAVPLRVTLPDPDDLAFLEVAAAAEAILVTGNKRHFPERARRGVVVLSPREFLDLLGRS